VILTDKQRAIMQTIAAEPGKQRKKFLALGLRAQGDLAELTFYRDKRGDHVVFPKTRPSGPATPLKLRQQNKFKVIGAAAWKHHFVRQEQFKMAARRLSLKMTGFNLFMAWKLTGDDAMIATIERQTGLDLTSWGPC